MTEISKAGLTRVIYAEEEMKVNGGKLIRKNIIDRFVVEANCTRNQAQTYYQTIRKSKGLISNPIPIK